MRVEHFLCFNNNRIKLHQLLRLMSVLRRYSVVVVSLYIVALIVSRFCVWSFCYSVLCVLLDLQSRERAVCFGCLPDVL